MTKGNEEVAHRVVVYLSKLKIVLYFTLLSVNNNLIVLVYTLFFKFWSEKTMRSAKYLLVIDLECLLVFDSVHGLIFNPDLRTLLGAIENDWMRKSVLSILILAQCFPTTRWLLKQMTDENDCAQIHRDFIISLMKEQTRQIIFDEKDIITYPSLDGKKSINKSLKEIDEIFNSLLCCTNANDIFFLSENKKLKEIAINYNLSPLGCFSRAEISRFNFFKLCKKKHAEVYVSIEALLNQFGMITKLVDVNHSVVLFAIELMNYFSSVEFNILIKRCFFTKEHLGKPVFMLFKNLIIPVICTIFKNATGQEAFCYSVESRTSFIRDFSQSGRVVIYLHDKIPYKNKKIKQKEEKRFLKKKIDFRSLRVHREGHLTQSGYNRLHNFFFELREKQAKELREAGRLRAIRYSSSDDAKPNDRPSSLVNKPIKVGNWLGLSEKTSEIEDYSSTFQKGYVPQPFYSDY